jgi:hypothetical protein
MGIAGTPEATLTGTISAAGHTRLTTERTASTLTGLWDPTAIFMDNTHRLMTGVTGVRRQIKQLAW